MEPSTRDAKIGDDKINFRLLRLSGESSAMCMPRSDVVEALVDRIRKSEEFAAPDKRWPVCKLLIDNRELKLPETLEEAGVTEGCNITLCLKRPPPLCDVCGKEWDVDAEGRMSDSEFPHVKLKCCGSRLCRDCYETADRAGQCQECNAKAFSFTTTSNELTSCCADDLLEAAQAPLDSSAVVEQPHWEGKKKPRPYQMEAFRLAAGENLIVNLPTGLGKTLVAVMLLDRFLESHPEKNVLFVVNTLTLVRQQAKAIRRESTRLGIKVEELVGGEVKWEEEYWREWRKGGHVLVGIAKVLQRALVDHAFLRMSETSLVVFDEAHHAIGQHPFVDIARRADDCSGQKPRFLGLTASYLHGKMSNPQAKREKLERSLRSRIWSPEEDDLCGFVQQQHFERATYDDVAVPAGVARAASEELLKPLLEDPELPDQVKKRLKEHSSKAELIFELLGAQSWRFFMEKAVCYRVRADLKQMMQVFKGSPKCKLEHLVKVVDEIVEARLKQGLDDLSAAEPWRSRLRDAPQISGKAEALLSRLEELQDASDLRCIVFVEQVATTYPLAHLINTRLGERASRPISGGGSMTDSEREENMELFRRGAISILVSTDTLEEGIDVSACSTVVRFDRFHNVKSHIQGQGRARRPGSVIIYFENDPEQEEADAARMQRVARGPSAWEPTVAGRPTSKRLPFVHPTTEAQLTPLNCLGILYEYVAKVLSSTMKPEQLFLTHEEWRGADTIRECRVPTRGGRLSVLEEEVVEFWREERGALVPSRSDFKELVRQEYPNLEWPELVWERRRFAFVTVWKLAMSGDMNDQNMPTEAALAAAEHCDHFLESQEASTAEKTSRQVRFDPQSFNGGTEGNLPSSLLPPIAAASSADVDVNTRDVGVLADSPPTAAVGSVGVDGGVRGTEPPAQPHVLASTQTATPSVLQDRANYKGAVNEFMQKQRGKVTYTVIQSGAAFQATAMLMKRDGSLLLSVTGQACSRRADAEKSAAKAAMDEVNAGAGHPEHGSQPSSAGGEQHGVQQPHAQHRVAVGGQPAIQGCVPGRAERPGLQSGVAACEHGCVQPQPSAASGEQRGAAQPEQSNAASAGTSGSVEPDPDAIAINSGSIIAEPKQHKVAESAQPSCPEPSAAARAATACLPPSAATGQVTAASQSTTAEPKQHKVAESAQPPCPEPSAAAGAATPCLQPSAATAQVTAASQPGGAVFGGQLRAAQPVPRQSSANVAQPSADGQPGAHGQPSDDHKSKLNVFVIRLLGRPVAKGDVIYECDTSMVPFQATVRLPCLPQHATRKFKGTIAYKRSAAEQSAAKSALEVLLPPRQAEVPRQQGGPAAAGRPADRASMTTTLPHTTDAPATAGIPQWSSVSTWCQQRGLSDLAMRLLEHHVECVEHLTQLSDEDLDKICEGFPLGVKAKFKWKVREMCGSWAA